MIKIHCSSLCYIQCASSGFGGDLPSAHNTGGAYSCSSIIIII